MVARCNTTGGCVLQPSRVLQPLHECLHARNHTARDDPSDSSCEWRDHRVPPDPMQCRAPYLLQVDLQRAGLGSNKGSEQRRRDLHQQCPLLQRHARQRPCCACAGTGETGGRIRVATSVPAAIGECLCTSRAPSSRSENGSDCCEPARCERKATLGVARVRLSITYYRRPGRSMRGVGQRRAAARPAQDGRLNPCWHQDAKVQSPSMTSRSPTDSPWCSALVCRRLLSPATVRNTPRLHTADAQGCKPPCRIPKAGHRAGQ